MTIAPRDAHAQRTWQNRSAGATWNGTGLGWSPDWWDSPNNDTLVFANLGSGNVTNNTGEWARNVSIVFNSGAASFTQLGDSINVLGKIENNSVNTQTISLNNISANNGAKELNPVSGNLVINSSNLYTGGASGEWRVFGNNGFTLTINGVVSEAGNLSIQQNSTVIFQKANTYSGGTFIRAGQLIISNGAAAGTGGITMGETNLIGASLTNALYLGTSGSGGGLTNTNNITVNSGGGASTIGANNTSGVNAFTGSITLNTGARFNVTNGGTLLLSGAIGGTGGFTNVGGGITLFSGANTYTGPTTISAGTLRLTNTAGRISDSSAVDIASGATFDLNGNNETVGSINGAGSIVLGSAQLIAGGNNSSTTYSGIMSGGGGFVKSGTGTLTLSGANTYTGQTYLVNGTTLYTVAPGSGSTNFINIGETSGSDSATFALTNGITITNALISRSGSSGSRTIQSLSTSGTNTLSGTLAMSNNTAFDSASGGTLLMSGVISNTGRLTKTGAGTLVLSANNSYSGGTLISGGVLSVTNVNSLGTGTLELGATTTRGTLLVNSNNTRSQSLLITDGSTNNVINVASSVTFTNSGALTQGGTSTATKFAKDGAGTLVLNAASGITYAGQVQIGQGAVIFGTANAFGTNTSTANRGIDLGLDIADAATANSVSLLISNGLTVGQSIYVAPSGTRTIGISGSGSVTLNNEIYLGGDLTVNAGSSATDVVTISGNVVSNGTTATGLIKTGSGTVVLSGSGNNYTGGTTISAGTLQVGAAGSTGALGTGAITNNGALVFNRTGSLSVSGAISGTGSLTKLAAGTVTLNGVGTYGGTTTISAGRLSLGVNNALGSSTAVTINGGQLDLGTTTNTIASLNVTSGSINRQGNALRIVGASTITGGALITNTANDSSLVFSNNLEAGAMTNIFAGSGAATADTLSLAGSLNYGSSATNTALFTNSSTGIARFNLGGAVRNFNITNSSSLGAALPEVAIYWNITNGGLTKTGDGVLLLGQTNTHTNTTLNGGTILLGTDTSLGTGAAIFTSGTISAATNVARSISNVVTINGNVTFGETSRGTGALNFTNTNAVNLSNVTRSLTIAADTKIDGTLTNGNLTKLGAATLSLSNANSSFGALTISAGQVNFQTNATITGLDGSAGTLALSGGTLTLNSATNNSFSLVISGAGNLTKSSAGTLTLGGANTYTGLTTINTGAISVAADNNLGAAPGAAVANEITMASGGKLVVTTGFTLNSNRGITLGSGGGGLDVAASQNLAYGGIIAGAGNALTKAGTGTLTLSGVNTYTGATTISAGALVLTGSGALSSSTAVNVSASGSVFDISGITAAGSTNGSLAGAAGSSVALGSKNLTVGGDNTSTTFAGVMSNTGSLTKVGTGTMTLTGANTYSGTTTISNGGIALGAASGTVIAGNVVIAGGTLDYTGAGTNQVSTNATATISSGLLSLANREQSFASMTMSGGTVSVSTGDLTNTAASSVTGGTNLITGTTGRIAFDGALTLGGAAFAYNNAGDSTDGVRLSSGGVSYSSTNTVGAVFSNASTGIGRLNLNGATVNFNIGDSASTNSEMNIAWAVQNGSLLKTGEGAMRMTASNSYTATTLDGGTLRLGNNNALGSGTVTFSNGVIASDSSTNRTFANAMNIVGNATFGDAVGTGTLTFSSTATNNLGGSNRTITTVVDTKIDGAIGNGGIAKAGSGTLILSNASSSFGALDISNGQVNFQTNATITGLSASGGSLALSGGTLTLNSSTNNSFGQVISGAGGLTKTNSGTLTLSGVNTYTGVTTINGGAVSVAAASGLGGNPGSATTNQLTLNGGALNVTTGFTANANSGLTVGASGGTVDVSSGQRLIQGGGLYGAGAFTKTGAGTMSLTNTAGAYAGSITVTNGVLQANTTLRGANISVGNASTIGGSVLMGSGQVGTVTINTNGQISPGNSVGTLSVSNSLTFNGGGSYLWEITNTTANTPGVGWDLISVDTTSYTNGLGSLTIGSTGTFTVNGTAFGGFSFDGAQNYTGDYFLVVRAASISGSLTNLAFSGSGLGSGSWAFSTNATGLYLNYTAAGSTITFTNTAGADQGAANIAGDNGAGAYATITNIGGATVVVVSNSAPLTFTNVNNAYTGATIIEQGTAVTTVDSANNANGAFGNAVTDIQVGSTNTGNANAATLLIGSGGVTVGRGVAINAGGSGLRTVGATNASGVATYSGNFAMATNVTLSASNSGGTTLFSGVLSGAGGVTAAGSGTVVLSGANTYTGSTTVTNGTTVLIANNTALGATNGATTVQSGGTLALSNNITVAEALTITGTGVGGTAGALQNASGNNTLSGAITLGSGGATITNASGSSLTLSGGITGAGQALTFNIGGGTNVITNTGINTSTGGSLIKNGAGVLVIAASSDYTGGTALNNGTLRVGSDTALGTGAITVSGSGGTISSADSSARTLANNFTMNGNLTVGSGSTGPLTLSGTMALGSSTRTITASAASTVFTISGVISGDTGVGLTKAGSGTMILTGANTYTGTTTVSAGTLSIGSGGASGSVDGAIDNSGTLIVNRTGDVTLGGVISGAGTFNKLGSGTLLLSGNNTFTGALAISNGAVRISNANGLGATNGATTVSSGAALELTGGITTAQESITLNGAGISGGGALRNISGNNTFAGTLTLGSASTIASDAGLLTISGGINGANFALTNTGSGNVTVSGAITNTTGALVKEGSGTLTLTGANTYSGGTLVSAGTLAGNTTGLQGTITNNSLVIFDQSSAGTYSSVVSGTGALTKTNAGVLTLTGDNTYSGGTMIGQGAISVGNGGATGSLVGVITNNGGLVFNRTGALSMTGAISGTGVLTNLGTGTVTLSGANTYSGGTLVTAGALQGNTTSLQGLITNDASVIFDQGTDGTYSSVMSGTGSLIKTNTAVLTLTGANTQTGTTIGQGTLSIGAGGTVGSVAGLITNNATLLYNRSDNLTQASVISGSGILNKAGAGTLTLSVANTYTGATTISNGAIRISDAAGLGTAAAGTTVISGAALELTGGITVGAEALTISGDGIGSGGALRNISGANTYGGTITLGAASSIAADSGSLAITGDINGANNNLAFTGISNIAVSGAITNSSGALTKGGAGSLTLSGSNTYTGATTISNGATIVAASANALGATNGATTVNSGGQLALSNATGFTSAESVTINGDGISSAGALRNIAGDNTNSGVITLGAASSIGADAGSLVLSGGINGAGFGLSFIGANNIAVSGNITNSSGALAKGGTGTLTLSGNNTYTGATTISNGATIVAASANALGATNGATTVNIGGQLALSNATGFTSAEGVTISGTGIAGAGALRNIAGANTNSGLVTLGAASTIASDAGSLLLSGGVNGASSLLTVTGSGNTTISGIISNTSAGLAKTGSGTLSLSGANTFTGTADIQNGTLAISGGSALADTANVSVASGANFAVNGSETIAQLSGTGTTTLAASQTLTSSFNSASNTYGGTLVGSGSFAKTGSGTLTLSGNSTSYSGETLLNNGTFLVGNNGAFGTGTVTINYDSGTGTRELASSSTSSYTLNNNFNLYYNSFTLGQAAGGTGSLTLGASTNTFFLGSDGSATYRSITVNGYQTIGAAVSGGGNNNIVKTGTGTLALSGANTFSGGVFIDQGAIDLAGGSISAGVIDIGGGSAGGAINASNAMLRVSTNGTFGRNITINAETNSTGSSGTRTIEFANSGGTATLSGTLSQEKAFTINVTNSGATGILSGVISSTGGGPTITVSGNGTLGVNNTANTTDARWSISSGATLAIGDTRNLGDNPGGYYSDKVTLNGGTLSATNNFSLNANVGIVVAANSTISVGNNLVMTNPAAMTGTGNLTKAGNGTLLLSGNNVTNSGRLIINSGVVSVGAASNMASNNVTNQITLDGGTLETTGGMTLGNRGITVGAGNGTINVTASGMTNTAGLYGAGNLVKTGSGTLSLTNTAGAYAGSVTVTNGVLQANTTLRGANISVGNAGTANGSVLTGSGQVGTVTINTNGQISPGNSVGVLSVSNSLTLNGGGSYLWEITNTTANTPGVGWDLISVDTTSYTNGLGSLTIGGSGQFTVAGTAINGFSFDTTANYTNDYFLIVRAGSISGSISNLSFSSSGLGSAGNWSFTTNSSGLYLNYTAPTAGLVFTNGVAADQGAAGLVTNNSAGAFATISDQGGVTSVTISNTAAVTFTNGANSYTGGTAIEQGTLVTIVNAGNAGGAFGTNSGTISIGSTNSGNANAATLLIGAGGVNVSKGIDVNAGGTGARTIGATNSSGVATYSGNITANTNVTLSASNANGTTLFSGTIAGSGAITAAGSGTVTLSGANTFTNNVGIASGATLVASNNSALGAGGGTTTVSNGATLALAGNISTAENVTIAGTGVGGNGALRNADGTNTNTGTITLSANASIAADTATTLTVGTVNLGSTTNQLTLGGNGTINLTGGITNTTTQSKIVKEGGGSLVISNNGTTGDAQMRIAGGSVTLASGGYSSNTGTGTRALDIGIDAANSSVTNNVAFYVNAGQTMSNSIYIAPAGTGGLGTRTVGTESTSGTATFSNQMYLGGDVQITSAGTANLIYSGNITNDGTHNVTKVGAGSLTLSSSNDWRGAFIAGAGTTILTNGNAIYDTNAVTISNTSTMVLGSSETIGSLAGAGTLSLGANDIVTGGNNANSVFSGVIQGSAGGDLFKAGTGTFTLAGVNTYSGDTVVNAGTLAFSNGSVNSSVIRLGPDGSAGDATVLLSDSDGGTTVNSTFVVRPGGGTRSLVSSNASGTNTYAGSVYLDGAATIAQQAAGVFALTGTEIDVKSHTLTLSSVTNGNVAVSSTIFDSGTDTGNLVKSGNGTVTLTGANAYAGSTLISGGTLQVGDGGATGQLGAGNVTNNASLLVNRTGDITIGNNVSGTGSLTKLGSGTLALTASNSFQGGSTLSAGVIRAAHANALGTGSLAASANTVLQVTNGVTISNNLSVYSVQFLNGGNTLSGTITNNNTVYDVNAGQTNTLSGFLTGSGSVTLIGGGVLNITGTTNNYTGNTVITNGTVRISTLNNTNTTGPLGVSNNITLAGASATNAIIDYTGGNVTTDRSFVVNGVATNGEGGTINMASSATEVTLTGSASGTGKLTVGEGTLILSNATANSFAPGAIQVDSGATLQLAANNQIGDSTGLILNGGTFRIGTASTGFSDTLGTLTLSASSTIDLGSFTTGVRQLTFANSSAITWTGTLTITNWQGVALQSSDVAEILFGTGGLTSAQLGQVYWANQNINGGTLIGGGGELVPIPEPRVYAAAVALLAAVGWRERKRLIGLLRRKRL